MKHLAYVCLLGLMLSVPAAAGPLYRAGHAKGAVSDLLHGEVSADYQFSSLQLQDYAAEYTSSALRGLSMRALWSPFTWLAVGMEYTHFGKTDLVPAWVDAYRANRVGGMIKLTLSPNTQPRLYLLAGYGRTQHQLDFRPLPGIQWKAVDKNIPYWMAGLGVETDVWKTIFAGLEGNIYWNKERKLGLHHQTASGMDTALRLRVGVRF